MGKKPSAQRPDQTRVGGEKKGTHRRDQGGMLSFTRLVLANFHIGEMGLVSVGSLEAPNCRFEVSIAES